MSLDIKNLTINVHVAGISSDDMQRTLEKMRTEILEECRDYVNEFVESKKER
ncbi:hypothetical protein [Fibrobacter succinogenes]|uniref:hypothetical protein n=1 Tax=Fibrobacter succinogenes TaxID=833 RepID=UPI00156658B9|nr:hypothetical protein [Fibrobacter succinogenes]